MGINIPVPSKAVKVTPTPTANPPIVTTTSIDTNPKPFDQPSTEDIKKIEEIKKQIKSMIQSNKIPKAKTTP